MALATVNMEDCNKKERCLSGPNAGLAYTPGSECPSGYTFNKEICDCDFDGFCDEPMRWQYTYTTQVNVSTSCPTGTSCDLVPFDTYGNVAGVYLTGNFTVGRRTTNFSGTNCLGPWENARQYFDYTDCDGNTTIDYNYADISIIAGSPVTVVATLPSEPGLPNSDPCS